MAKSLLKVAGILNLTIGSLVLIVSLILFSGGPLAFFAVIGMVVAAIRLGIGGTFFSVANKDGDDFTRYSGYVLAASIVSILTAHVLSFILGIIAYADMYSVEPKGNQTSKVLSAEEKSKRRLRNLLALGCGLVLLAGIIFAMTTWETLSGIGKTIALIITSLIFFAMSYLADKKFNLKTSSLTYYILANAFTVFTFVAAGFFCVFGEWFSLTGKGTDLYQAFLWVLTGMLGYLAYLKYEKLNLFYVVYFSIIMLIAALLNFIDKGEDVTVFFVTVILAVLASIPFEKKLLKPLGKLARAMLPILGFEIFLVISSLNAGDRMVWDLLAFGAAFVSMYYLASVNNNKFFQVFAPIFTLATSATFVAVTGLESGVVFAQLLLIIALIYIIGFFKRDQKLLGAFTSAACDIALVYVLFDSINMGFGYYAIIAGIMMMAISLLSSASGKVGKYYFEVLLEPIKVALLAYAVYKFIYRFDYTESSLFAACIGLILSVVCAFRKDILKKLYFVGGALVTVFCVFNIAHEFLPVSQIINVVSLAVLTFVTFMTDDIKLKKCKEIFYGLELAALAIAFINIAEHFDMTLVGTVLLTGTYMILLLLFKKNDILRYFTIVALLVPYSVTLPISVWSENVNYLLYSLIWLVLIFIYTRGFLESVRLKTVNIIEMVTLSIWYLILSSKVSLEVAIFVGVISFVSILIGFKSQKWISLYYTGIAFLILNVIIQLKEFWTSIPIWAYILLAGLVLIGFVTYKEYNRNNENQEPEKVEAELVDQPKNSVNIKKVDTRAIIVGSILYAIVIPMLLNIIY